MWESNKESFGTCTVKRMDTVHIGLLILFILNVYLLHASEEMLSMLSRLNNLSCKWGNEHQPNIFKAVRAVKRKTSGNNEKIAKSIIALVFLKPYMSLSILRLKYVLLCAGL